MKSLFSKFKMDESQIYDKIATSKRIMIACIEKINIQTYIVYDLFNNVFHLLHIHGSLYNHFIKIVATAYQSAPDIFSVFQGTLKLRYFYLKNICMFLNKDNYSFGTSYF